MLAGYARNHATEVAHKPSQGVPALSIRRARHRKAKERETPIKDITVSETITKGVSFFAKGQA